MHRSSAGQSLVEFAIGALVLVILLAGAGDLARAFYYGVAIEGAARDAARTGAWYDTSSRTDATRPANPNLFDSRLLALVNRSLQPLGLAATATTGCTSGAGGGTEPPYPDSAYPPAAGQVYVSLCYRQAGYVNPAGSLASPGSGYGQGDVQVAVLMRLDMGLTSNVIAPSIPLAASVHMPIQGPGGA